MNPLYVLVPLGLVLFVVAAVLVSWARVSSLQSKLDSVIVKFRTIEAQLRSSIQTHFNNKYQQDVKTEINRLHANLGSANAEQLAEEGAAQQLELATQWMTGQVEHHFNRLKQEITAEAEGKASHRFRDLQMGVTDRIWRTFQQYKEKCDDEPLLFPPGVRLAYTRGNRTVLMIEQKPTVRPLAFTEQVKNGNSKSSSTEKGRTRYNLAMPYVYFFAIFDKQKLKNFAVYVRSAPLNTSFDPVYPIPLPNVFFNKGQFNRMQCMGEDFWNSLPKGLSMSQTALYAVDYYWQSPFNGHLGVGFYSDLSPKMKTLSLWEDSSMKDPLFILQMNWKEPITVKALVEQWIEWREMKHELDGAEKALQQVINSSTAQIVKDLEASVEQARKDYTLSLNKIKADADKQLTDILKQHSVAVMNKVLNR